MGPNWTRINENFIITVAWTACQTILASYVLLFVDGLASIIYMKNFEACQCQHKAERQPTIIVARQCQLHHSSSGACDLIISSMQCAVVILSMILFSATDRALLTCCTLNPRDTIDSCFLTNIIGSQLVPQTTLVNSDF